MKKRLLHRGDFLRGCKRLRLRFQQRESPPLLENARRVGNEREGRIDDKRWQYFRKQKIGPI